MRPDHVATAFFSALMMAFLAAFGMWFAAPLIAKFLQIPELTQDPEVTAWLTPFGAFSVLCEALLARSMQVKKVAHAFALQLHDLDFPRGDPTGLVWVRVLVARRHAGGQTSS